MAAQISMWTKVDPELLETLRLPGFMFRLTEKLLWEAFDQFFDGFRAKGAYVFECQRSRYLGLLPTWDPWEVIASMGTHADNFDLDTEQIISWLTALNRDQPFTLCGAGYDFVAGRFVTKIESSRTVARRIFEFCPDAVTELTGSLPALALSIKRRREFLLWWD
jgi:hypothetical protein